jgi:hypothetical protein
LLLKTTLRLECGLSCRCQCHSQRVDYQSPSWLKPILGQFFLSYQSRPILSPVACDLVSCRNSRSPAHLNYYFPTWAWTHAVSVTASIFSLSGPGATLHASFPRLLKDNAEIWFNIHYGGTQKAVMNIKKDHILPSDRDMNGLTVLSVCASSEFYCRPSNLTVGAVFSMQCACTQSL